MHKWKKWYKWILYPLVGLLALFIGLAIYLYTVAIVDPPATTDTACLQWQRSSSGKDQYRIGNNWIRKKQEGLWELYVEGKPFERGVAAGKLAKELVYYQEEAFQAQIAKMIPSSFYRHFLKYFIGWFNRNLDQHLTEEEKLEIYGVSESASHEFDYIGSPYQRLLNYHAAHDIGHALQNMALVGCSSFATWNERSVEGELILGRNFDFYVGDQFAQHKMVEFVKPDKGHSFMMVTWGGMTGVVSGMNMAGLSITLNSDKSDIPSGSATPVSLLARQILQYAGTIEEAIRLAKGRKTFVSESFMIGSAADNRAVVIEKTPDTLSIHESTKPELICTNHFEGKELVNSASNVQQMQKSASVYRHERIEELLQQHSKNSVQSTAAILRDQLGLNGKFIGWGNEKAVNQLICHHSIIFEPRQRKVWVSTNPWQLGAYVAYDLNKVFAGKPEENIRSTTELDLPADTFLKTQGFKDFMTFRSIKQTYLDGQSIDLPALIRSNPAYYHTYVIAGDYCRKQGYLKAAIVYYRLALRKEIATINEQEYIQQQLDNCLAQLAA